MPSSRKRKSNTVTTTTKAKSTSKKASASAPAKKAKVVKSTKSKKGKGKKEEAEDNENEEEEVADEEVDEEKEAAAPPSSESSRPGLRSSVPPSARALRAQLREEGSYVGPDNYTEFDQKSLLSFLHENRVSAQKSLSLDELKQRVSRFFDQTLLPEPLPAHTNPLNAPAIDKLIQYRISIQCGASNSRSGSDNSGRIEGVNRAINLIAKATDLVHNKTTAKKVGVGMGLQQYLFPTDAGRERAIKNIREMYNAI